MNPRNAYSAGKKFIYQDDQETPNTQTVVYDYGDCELQFEVRGLNTGGEDSMGLRGGNFIGVMFFGSKGYMTVEDSGFKTFLGDKREPGENMVMQEKKEDENFPHMTNFLDAVKSRRREDLHADVAEAAMSADLIHIATISYRTGRKLVLESGPTRFVSDDQANHLLARHPYRAPYVVS